MTIAAAFRDGRDEGLEFFSMPCAWQCLRVAFLAISHIPRHSRSAGTRVPRRFVKATQGLGRTLGCETKLWAVLEMLSRSEAACRIYSGRFVLVRFPSAGKRIDKGPRAYRSILGGGAAMANR